MREKDGETAGERESEKRGGDRGREGGKRVSLLYAGNSIQLMWNFGGILQRSLLSWPLNLTKAHLIVSLEPRLYLLSTEIQQKKDPL